MTEEFEIKVASLPDYEELVAEIYVQQKFIGLLSQEAYPRIVFEIQSYGPMRLDLAVFEKALGTAKERLWDVRKK